MNDLVMGATWLGVLGAGLATALVLRAFGVATTYVRDLLHVGAGVWVIGWPWWHDPVVPVAIVVGVAIALALVPMLARRSTFVQRLEASVSDGDERWSGLVLYAIAYAVFTPVALAGDPFPAAAALLALSLGDGIGGAVGRAVGEHHFRAPGGKRKSFEGSFVVFSAAVVAALLAAVLFAVPLGLPGAIALGAVAALAEAFAPRGTDNLLVPITVYVAAHLVT